MIKYTVIIRPSAEKEMFGLEKIEQKKIFNALEKLAHHPRPAGCKKLIGSPLWRIRVGNYRIVYSIEDNVLKVFIIRIAHRKEVYR